jgi:uncharacterized membrane protein
VETKLRHSTSVKKKQDENQGLRTERQILLYRQREAAKRERAERCEVEARVRHLNFELIQRIVLLVLSVIIGMVAVLGAFNDPELLKLASGAAAVWGMIAAALYRWGGRRERRS